MMSNIKKEKVMKCKNCKKEVSDVLSCSMMEQFGFKRDDHFCHQCFWDLLGEDESEKTEIEKLKKANKELLLENAQLRKEGEGMIEYCEGLKKKK